MRLFKVNQADTNTMSTVNVEAECSKRVVLGRARHRRESPPCSAACTIDSTTWQCRSDHQAHSSREEQREGRTNEGSWEPRRRQAHSTSSAQLGRASAGQDTVSTSRSQAATSLKRGTVTTTCGPIRAAQQIRPIRQARKRCTFKRARLVKRGQITSCAGLPSA